LRRAVPEQYRWAAAYHSIMDTQERIKELEKARWKSKRHLPGCIVLAILGLAVIWWARHSVGLTLIVFVFSIGPLLGDLINIIYCGRRLQKLQHENPAT